MREAEKAGAWDRAVALRKEEVRSGCSNQYRWFELVNTLIEALRTPKATRVLQEMDLRDFEVNPALPDEEFPRISKFMGSREFEASPLGLKVKRLEAISDERRIKFQEALNAMPSSEKPPENYIAKGVCPFECCRYGDWTVSEDTDLVANPGSRRVVGRAQKGTRVAGLTGEVHLGAEPVVVILDGDLPKNTIAFVLDSAGEGYGHVYSRGKVVETFLGYARYCFRPSQSCWGETLLPSKARKEPVWWVKIRLANGVAGWTTKTENFGGQDACG
jgi:hypothetical protein